MDRRTFLAHSTLVATVPLLKTGMELGNGAVAPGSNQPLSKVEITTEPDGVKILVDGELVRGAYHVKVEIDAEDELPRVHLDVYAAELIYNGKSVVERKVQP